MTQFAADQASLAQLQTDRLQLPSPARLRLFELRSLHAGALQLAIVHRNEHFEGLVLDARIQTAAEVAERFKRICLLNQRRLVELLVRTHHKLFVRRAQHCRRVARLVRLEQIL